MQAKPPRVSLDDLIALATRSAKVHEDVRAEMLAPHPRKRPPLFTVSQVAELCGLEKKKFEYAVSKRDDLPTGSIADGKRRRLFTLAETRLLVKVLSSRPHRPVGTPGVTIACVNFKGGSSKTTTAFNLAQGLTLLGRSVLLVDLDPQGSATTLTGLMPAVEIEEEDTASMLTIIPLEHAPKDLAYAVRETYWDGLNLVPAAPQLYNAELILPVLARDPKIEWWSIMSNAINPLREQYDYIIFDTAPSLSYLAVNAIVAADGLVMPLPPENLDYSSSVAFWSLVTETLGSLVTGKSLQKDFAFVNVVLSKVSTKPANAMVKAWILKSYREHVLPTEIPLSEVSSIGAVQFGTVHDVCDDDGASKTNSKLREAYDRFVHAVDDQTVACNWGERDGN